MRFWSLTVSKFTRVEINGSSWITLYCTGSLPYLQIYSEIRHIFFWYYHVFIATGKPPFRDGQFDRDFLCHILSGLRPTMPDSAPDEYKRLAQHCWDADPVKRPSTGEVCVLLNQMKRIDFDDRISIIS